MNRGGRKGFHGGSPASECPGLILKAMGENKILSVGDLHRALGKNYHVRTIQEHVKKLLKEKKITGGMRKGTGTGIPLYRIASIVKPVRKESEEEYLARVDQEETYERIRDGP